jgi:hypothetical protein
VSRWSAERLRIGLAPERVDLARVRFGLSRETARQSSVSCVPKPGEAPWQAALAALDGALNESGSRGGAAAVVLSNHWVRYAVLPWQPSVTSPAEVEQLARLHFERSFGAAAASWTVRTCDRGYGAAHLACAVDTALITALQACLAAHDVRLGTLQPLLMAAYNDARREFSGSTAFAIVEPGRVCLGLLQQDRWLAVASRRTGADLGEAIEQELATLDTDAVPARLDVLLVGAETSWAAPATRAARLLGGPAARGRSLAMCGTA